MNKLKWLNANYIGVAAVTTIAAIATIVSVGASAAPAPNLKPGQYEYSTITEVFGIKIPVNFKHCVTQKDVDEGRQLAAQKDAGMDCKYSDLKQTGNHYMFTATCSGKNMPEPMIMTYDMTASATQFESKMTMTGGNTKAMGGKMNMTMSAKRTGGC